MIETRNVYISFTSSFMVHILIFSFYLFLKEAQKANILLLENIELIEIEPDIHVAQQMPIPKQAPPKSMLDFVKMALPSFRKPKFQEIAEPEIDSKIKKELPEKIDLKKTIEARPKSRISLTRNKYEKSEKLSEVIPEKELDNKEKLALLSPQGPAIDISEVGKVAIKGNSFSQPISLNKRTVSSSLKEFKEVEVSRAKKTYRPQVLKETTVSIGKRKPASGKLPLGYGKGISLTKQKKRTRKLSQELNIVEPVTRKTEKIDFSKVREAKPDKKSVEITGPVVGRKILASYLPVYPDWAKVKNVEANVIIRFYVAPEGTVREKLYLERTSGYSTLDKLAMDALRKWIFEPIKTGAGDQWGMITFRYLLK